MTTGAVPSRSPDLGADLTLGRRVEPAHAGAWPVRQPRPFAEALLERNEMRRDADRVEFSDELCRLNEERRLRSQACEQTHGVCDSDSPEPVASVRPAQTLRTHENETTEIVREIRETYEVTRRSATGRLIDMLM